MTSGVVRRFELNWVRTENNFRLQKNRRETELESARESIRTKEIGVLAATRVLRIKDKELNSVRNRLDAREKELNRLKEEKLKDTSDLKKLYGLAQERIREISIGDLAIELNNFNWSLLGWNTPLTILLLNVKISLCCMTEWYEECFSTES